LGKTVPVTVSSQTAYNRTMLDASDAAKELAMSYNGNAVELDKIPKQSKAATVGLKLLSAAGNMLLSWGLTMALQLAVKWLDKVIVTTDEYREKQKRPCSIFCKVLLPLIPTILTFHALTQLTTTNTEQTSRQPSTTCRNLFDVSRSTSRTLRDVLLL
jgi:hypothetical protein